MNTLLALIGFTIPADVDSLAHKSYSVRSKAYSRIAEAGWLAYPWLRSGMMNTCYEQSESCSVLATKVDNRFTTLLAETTIRGGYYYHAEYWGTSDREMILARHILRKGYFSAAIAWVNIPWVKTYTIFDDTTSKFGDIGYLILKAHENYKEKEKK